MFIGEVAGIDKIGVQSSGVANYPVIVKFSTDSSKVLPNMSVTADIITATKENVLIVPNGAVISGKKSKSVNLATPQGSKKIDIATGISDESNTEVLSGLTQGDIVLINSLPISGFTSSTNSSREGSRGGGINMMRPPGM